MSDAIFRFITAHETVKANDLAAQRLEAKEYKRDARLSNDERIQKIADGYLGDFAFADFLVNLDVEYEYSGEYIA